MAARGVEVLRCRLEGQPGPHGPGFVGERPHQPVVEGRIGDHVDDRGAGGQDPVLHPQMRDAAGQPVDRPVPPVDRAVVQDEFGQRRHTALVEDPQWVLLVADRQQGWVEAHVLLEELVRGTDPALPEPGPRAHPLITEFGRPHVRGLLEERRPRLAPQLLAEQEGRVGSECDLHGRDGLGRVPYVREAVRRHLQVQLNRCARRFRRDRSRGRDQSLDPFDIEDEFLAARGRHLIVEERITVDVRQVRRHHVVPPQGRQDADHHDPGIDLRGLPVRIGEPRAQLLSQLIEYPAAQPVGKNIHFQVEHPQFRLEIPAGDALEHLCIPHPRHAVRTREIQLDLQPHEISGAIEPPLRQEPLQSLQALGELLAVRLPIGRGKGTRHDLLAHRRVPPRVGGPRPRPLVSRSIMPRRDDP